MATDSGSIGKFLVGMLAGVALTGLYVRFGYKLPGILGLGKKLSENAIVTTAEIDLYDHEQAEDVRKRALAVVIGQRPELFMELDASGGNRIYEEVLRRKAVREAKLLKGRLTAYDAALSKPALRRHFEKKHRVSGTETLKRSMLKSDLRDEDYLYGYLTRRFPDASLDQLADIVLGVYQNGLRAGLTSLSDKANQPVSVSSETPQIR